MVRAYRLGLVRFLDESRGPSHDAAVADPGLARLLLDAYRTVDAEVAAALEDLVADEE